jgi:Protein of unknown function (DUF2982)
MFLEFLARARTELRLGGEIIRSEDLDGEYAAMYCVLCGTENPEYGSFCRKCGKPLIGEHEPDTSVPIRPSPGSLSQPSRTTSPIQYGSARRGGVAPVAERLEIKPKTARNVTFLIIGDFLFTAMGFYMISTGETQNIASGLLCIVFFGGGGLIMIPKLLRRKVSMVLTREEMEQITPYGKAHIRWIDVEKLGVVSLFANKMVGIRLRSYDAYVQSMSPDMTEFLRKTLPYMKLLARGASMLSVPQVCKLWSRLEGSPDPREALKAFGKVGSYVQAMLWTREQYGYDVLIAWQDRDRSARALLDLLQAYCGRA